MTPKQALAQLIQLFALFLFFAMSLSLTALWAYPELKILLAEAVLNDPDVSLWAAAILWGATFLLFVGLYMAHKGRVWILRMGTHSVGLDLGVMRPLLDRLFSQSFKGKLRISDLEVEGGYRLAMEFSLAPNLTLQERERLLISAEQHLERFLRDRFGYRQPFKVSLREDG